MFGPVEAVVRSRLKHACERNGWSQKAFGRYLEQVMHERWPQPRVYKLLNGRLPLRLDVIVAAANVIGVSVVDLLEDPTLLAITRISPGEQQLLRLLRARGPESDQILEAVVTLLAPAREPRVPIKHDRPGRPRKTPVDTDRSNPDK